MRRIEMKKALLLWCLALGMSLMVPITGVPNAELNAQSSNTPVNLTGMWTIELENGKKGWMNIVYQTAGAESYKGRASIPDCGEFNVNSIQVREHFKLGNDAIFNAAGSSGALQYIVFDKMASASMVSGKIMAGQGNLFPGHVAQIKFIARKG
jgi:hypothetical protein